MTSKFHRAKKAQPFPRVCSKPPLPLPPDAPIETLRAYGQVTWHTFFNPYVNFIFDVSLRKIGPEPIYACSGDIIGTTYSLDIYSAYHGGWPPFGTWFLFYDHAILMAAALFRDPEPSRQNPWPPAYHDKFSGTPDFLPLLHVTL